MDVVTGVFQILAVVVVVGGAAKLVTPAAFATTLRTLGLPGGTAAARLAGLVEVVVGVTALVAGAPAAAALAALYAVFTVVVLVARRRGAESCGCFGQIAAPPSVVHVVVNAASALVALAAAVAGVEGLAEVLAEQPWAGVPYLVTVATGAWLVVVLDTVGARVVDEIGEVHRLGPVFRDQSRAATVPARTVPRAQRRRGGPTGGD